jgi:hypothetical protein
MNVYVTSELYVAGTTEDGHPYTAERYLVAVEAASGARHLHNTFFNGCEVSVDEDEGYTAFVDVREEAMAAAEKLAARVREAGMINLVHWYETQPAYGSDAYDRGGYEMLRKFEEQQQG